MTQNSSPALLGVFEASSAPFCRVWKPNKCEAWCAAVTSVHARGGLEVCTAYMACKVNISFESNVLHYVSQRTPRVSAIAMPCVGFICSDSPPSAFWRFSAHHPWYIAPECRDSLQRPLIKTAKWWTWCTMPIRSNTYSTMTHSK